MNHLAEYIGLFAAALLSATILPFQSEVVLFGLLIFEHYNWLLLVLVASAGNTTGSAVNWCLGRFLAELENRPWFPLKRQALASAEGWYHRYGRWSLFLSWLPFIGDPLTIAAGLMRELFPVFLGIVAVAKTARYFAVVAVTFGWL